MADSVSLDMYKAHFQLICNDPQNDWRTNIKAQTLALHGKRDWLIELVTA